MGEMINVPRERYDYLVQRNRRLSAMEAGGVDNWEGLHYALEQGGLIEDEEDGGDFIDEDDDQD